MQVMQQQQQIDNNDSARINRKIALFVAAASMVSGSSFLNWDLAGSSSLRVKKVEELLSLPRGANFQLYLQLHAGPLHPLHPGHGRFQTYRVALLNNGMLVKIASLYDLLHLLSVQVDDLVSREDLIFPVNVYDFNWKHREAWANLPLLATDEAQTLLEKGF